MNSKGYPLQKELLNEWGKRLIPEKEWFFFSEAVPGLELLDFASLGRFDIPLDIRTSYGTWSLHGDVKYYTIMSSEQFSTLPDTTQSAIIKEQWRMGRGLLFGLEELAELTGVSKRTLPCVMLDGVKISNLNIGVWNGFSEEVRHRFLMGYGAFWIDDNAFWDKHGDDFKSGITMTYPSLRNRIDRFSPMNGPNCLGAVAAAMTGELHYFDCWMQEREFLSIVGDQGYTELTAGDYKGRDVLIWFNEEGGVIHSSFILDSLHAFNKHGQTMFNPWQIIRIDELIKKWDLPGCHYKQFRSI
ncbi:hypothetical protein LCM10_02230 [Rossellomorea aquimaris]|uniref:hypothetical protein n=1 Tax=Rossellomorea aquimaris TaxID=189382 RepID=UPI001CD1ECC6|nr:hypothetical protein [Rossellomorea aquimaris]MCA1053789.1 hypothetical protein [Rossellomorea aquimaris]